VTDDHDDTFSRSGFSRPGDREQVGSVGDEAAKLLAAVQGWAREHVGDQARHDGLGSAYISDGSAACRVCPLCQLIALVRGVNPEALEQLGHAAGSFLHALAHLVEDAHGSDRRRRGPVQKIDLADDPDDPENPWA
jgi:hypothetical protein